MCEEHGLDESRSVCKKCVANVAKRPAFDLVGGRTPFAGEGKEGIEAAWVWETKLHGFDGGCWFVGWSMFLLFISSRGCNVREWG